MIFSACEQDGPVEDHVCFGWYRVNRVTITGFVIGGEIFRCDCICHHENED